MPTEARVADYEREDMLYKEQARLVAELAEARAQIAVLTKAQVEAVDMASEAHRQAVEARAQNKDAYELAYSVARHDMEVQLAEARAQIAAHETEWQKLRDLFGLDGWYDGKWQGIPAPSQIVTHVDYIANDRAEARAQIAAKDAALLRDANKEIYCANTGFKDAIRQRNEARAQIAAKDAALDALDEAHQITQQGLWQDITELRASLAGKEQEHQDFRLQNDAEWRAKLDHLKAQIAAKDAALRRAREALVCWNGYVQNVDDDIAVIDAALAAGAT